MADQAPIALVTGASRGAGRGIAIALGRRGCTVYVTGRSQQAGDHALPGTIFDTARAVTEAGGKGVAVACDHSDDEQVAELYNRILADEGRIDLLVNNAAAIHDELTQAGEFWEKPPEPLSAVLQDLNRTGASPSHPSGWSPGPLRG
jgi:NAD(P)-dependent dehydrogenase (short-subunit alcohol dehydrogenase family)